MAPKTSELLDFYYGELYDEVKALEQERKRRRLWVLLAWGVLAAAALFTVWHLLSLRRHGPDMALWAVMGAFAAGSAVYGWLVADFRRRFKRRVFGRIVGRIDPSLRYEPERYVDRTLFEASALFNARIDRYEGSDFMQGRIKKTPLRFSTVRAYKRQKDERGHTRWVSIFSGTFVVTDFHKHFVGTVRIYPDIAERYLGVVGGWLQDMGSKGLVRMDSPAFEKLFKVVADDPVEAHYLLTPNLMERIVALQKRAEAPIYLSFRLNKLFIAIADGGGRFEPSLWRSLLGTRIFLEYIENLNLILGIVDELNLNRRIWSKE